MNKPGLLLLGAGGHAHACLDVIEQHGQYEIVGLVGSPEEVNTIKFGYTVIGSDCDLPNLTKVCRNVLVTVGHIRSATNRMRLYRLAIELGFRLPTIVSPLAYVSAKAAIGVGTIVMHGAIVNAGARLGKNCIVNTRALIEHDTIIEDHCHISTGAILNGAVRLGEGSFVGSGSTVRECIVLGKGSTVGIGVAVRHNQPDGARIFG